MPAHTYKIIELVGTSPDGVSEAIDAAVTRASQSLKGLDWFEVGSIRGEIEDGKIAWYQVTVRVGFRIMAHEELRA